MTEQDRLMKEGRISQVVAKMAVPSAISSLVTVVYNMADTFFVGQTGDPLQVAAVSLTNPCFILMMAIANIFGMGGSAMVSMALGQQDEKRANKTAAFVFYASMIVGAILMALFLVFMQPILRIFGADNDTMDFAAGYLRYVAYGAPFIIWSAAASFVVRSAGFSTEAMIGSMIGTIANIILDPIFISVFYQGAAIATTIGNSLACIYYFWFFVSSKHPLSIAPRYMRHITTIPADVVRIGLPTGIFSALMSISTIILNQIMVVYGNAAVAAIGIVFKANMFIAFLQMGIANGVQPILGYVYGAGDMKRFRDVESYTRKILIITGVLCTLLYFVFRWQIISLFIDDTEVISYGVPMLVGYMLSGPFIGILFLNMDCMQSVGRSFPATILSIFRQGVILIPLLYLTRAVFGFYGVICAQSVTDYITIILSQILWQKMRKTL